MSPDAQLDLHLGGCVVVRLHGCHFFLQLRHLGLTCCGAKRDRRSVNVLFAPSFGLHRVAEVASVDVPLCVAQFLEFFGVDDIDVGAAGMHSRGLDSVARRLGQVRVDLAYEQVDVVHGTLAHPRSREQLIVRRVACLSK